MTRNYTELERELIDDLRQRSGRDLEQWMAAIDGAGLVGKNAIIDWLRPQGFTFANASWLERIHNNGGRPIYLDQAASPPRPARPAPTSGQPPALEPRAPAHRLAPAPPSASASTDADPIREIVARGKAFRPLAEHLLGEIARTLPELAISATDDLIVLSRPRILGVLWVSPRELRLGLDLGDRPFDATVLKAKLPGTGATITHMLLLNDARQIGRPLLDLVGQADARANPPPPGA